MHINVTGLIASGKSTLVKVWESRGASIVSSDEVAREVVEVGTRGLELITQRWGTDVLHSTGELDRAALAGRVFADSAEREALNQILHPLIESRTREKLTSAKEGTVVVLDVPLLVQSGLDHDAVANVVVHADATERIARMVRDRGMSEAEARARINSQMSADELEAYADVIVTNESSVDEFATVANQLWDGWVVPFRENVERGARVAGEVARLPGVDVREPVDVIEKRLQRRGIDASYDAGGSRFCAAHVGEAGLRQAGWVLERGIDGADSPGGVAVPANPTQHTPLVWRA